MQNKKNTFVILFLFTINLVIFGQSSPRDLSQTMLQIRQNKYFQGINPFQATINTQPAMLIKEAELYLTDTLPLVRSFAYEIIYAAGKKSSDQIIRQQVVLDLVLGSKDKGTGIAGKTSLFLQQYKREEFSNAAKDSIIAIIGRGKGYIENILLIAGYLNLANAIENIRTVISNPAQNEKTKWAAHLALSRLGDVSEINYCIRILEARPLSNSIVYNLVPGLIYTHQKAAYDYLITILNSNEKSCMSANPDSGGQIVCGYRIMEFLAPVIVDFPLETIPGLNQIKTNNYDASLEAARAWFKQHQKDYMIQDEKF